MSASKPGIMELIRNAMNHLADNKEIYWEHLKPLLPYIIVLEFGGQIFGKLGYEWVAPLFGLVLIYFYACFALACHKTSLLGPSKDHTVNPFSIKPEDRRFFKFFYLLFFVPFLTGIVIGGLVTLLSHSGSPILLILGIIVAVIVFIYMMIELMRISFILPASSVGMKINISEARKVSKGLLWRLVGSTLLISFIAALTMMVYLITVGFTVALIMAGVGQGLAYYIMQTAVTLPVLAVNIALAAIFVNILSRLYQWGMQHNS